MNYKEFLIVINWVVVLFCFQLFETTECGNGYVEAGEECDCGFRMASKELHIILTKYIKLNDW